MPVVPHQMSGEFDQDGEQGVALETRTKTKRPPLYKKGMAVVGIFSHEIAETKVAQVMDFSRRHQHPLQCTMEKE